MSAPAQLDPAQFDAVEGGVRDVAVIDLGSNSVRLVVFRLDAGAITPIFNEKVMAGLGRRLRETGKLCPEGVETALKALKRFSLLIAAMGVARVEAVATAALREAGDGPGFLARVREETGLAPRVISGADEARLSALGVLAGAPEADGVVGDLGGSSLELVSVAGGRPGAGATFPLGPFSLIDPGGFDPARVAAVADAALADASVLTGGAGRTFYAVGGAWRAIGRIDIALRNHPLGVLHHHAIDRAEALKVCAFVSRQSRKSLERLGDASAQRAEMLPCAAIVLQRVLTLGAFERVILSSFGLREGLLYEAMGPGERRADPLVASAAAFSARDPRARAYGAALAEWLEPAFAPLPSVFPPGREALLRRAAAMLSEIGARLHPDQRAEIMFDLILRAPLAGVSHPERAFLAASVHHRHARATPDQHPAYLRLLDPAAQRRAAALGAAMRLGSELSGRCAALLDPFRLELTAASVNLHAPGAEALITPAVPRRLGVLAELLERAPELRF